MALIVAYRFQTRIINIIICRPITVNWDLIAQGHCGNPKLAYRAIKIVDIITDVAIIILLLGLVDEEDAQGRHDTRVWL